MKSTAPRSSIRAGTGIEPKFQLESGDGSKKTRSSLLLRDKRRMTYLNASPEASTALVIAPMGHSAFHRDAGAIPCVMAPCHSEPISRQVGQDRSSLALSPRTNTKSGLCFEPGCCTVAPEISLSLEARSES